MKLVTFQSREALDFLNDNGFLICNEKHIDLKKASVAYDWVIKEMSKRIKNNTNAKYPIWCWVKCNNSICPPKHRGQKIKGFDIKITFNADDNKVFVTDFRRFSFILNNTYIPDDKEDKEKFDRLLHDHHITKEELKAYVRRDKYTHHREDEVFLRICRLIEDSFEKCITDNGNILQGCVWQIKKEDVINIEILKDNGYTYGSLNYKRKNGTRRNWVEEYYEKLPARKINLARV